MDQKDFVAEYAKSGRAACKKCKDLISQGSLRIAHMVQSPFFDGRMPVWHHFNCFFRLREIPRSVDEVRAVTW